MENKKIEENVRMYIKYLNSQNNQNISEEEKQALLYVSDLCKLDKEFGENILKIKNSSSEQEALALLKDYLINQELKKSKSEEEIISKTFGIDIKDIEHKKLNTGKDVFIIYDDKIGRKRIIENPKDKKSLVQFLKEQQNDNQKFQTDDYKANSKAIINEQINETNLELDLIYVSDIYKYMDIISRSDEKIRFCLTELIKNKEKLNFEYINLRNAFALDKDGNIIEAIYNEEKNMVDLQEPKEYSYNSTEMSNENNSDTIKEDNNIDSEEEIKETENNIEADDFEDIPKILEEEKIEGEKKEETIQNMKKYYKNPDEMLTLPPDEKLYYERLVSILAERIEQKRKNKNSNVMILKKENNYGFSNILLVSIFLIVVAIIVFILIK